MKRIFLLLFALVTTTVVCTQNLVNYDESKVPEYKLPDPLKCFGGQRVNKIKTWEKKRRPELVNAFEELVYGRVPEKLELTSYRIAEESPDALGGRAIRRQVVLTVKKNNYELNMNLLMYLPKVNRKVPVFVGCNFKGNHSVTTDSMVIITNSWTVNEPSFGIINNQFTEQSRGVESGKWSVNRIIGSGYGVATIYYGDIDPDKDDFTDGPHPFFYNNGQVRPAGNEWGSIAAWAWGLSRVMDYFEKDSLIDASRVIVMGHSRLGKTALWAGASDKRFAMVISNNSGCGGAALSKRIFGETVKSITTSFPHWFCTNFRSFINNESSLPVDQHELIALIAPRPVYIASAAQDLWADPKGEYLSGFFASSVSKLYGKTGLASPEMPSVNQPVMNTIGYHIRTGKHDVTDYDWEQFIKFADIHLMK